VSGFLSYECASRGCGCGRCEPDDEPSPDPPEDLMPETTNLHLVAQSLAERASNLKTRLTENVEAIDLFEQECAEVQHTDTGEAWKVLNDLRASLKNTLTLI